MALAARLQASMRILGLGREGVHRVITYLSVKLVACAAAASYTLLLPSALSAFMDGTSRNIRWLNCKDAREQAEED